MTRDTYVIVGMLSVLFRLVLYLVYMAFDFGERALNFLDDFAKYFLVFVTFVYIVSEVYNG